jgi:hypothetical protein
MLFIIIYLLLLAALLAKLELMTEGRKSGWAAHLPCWRINNWFTQLVLGKELTGYHFWLVVLFLFLFHGSFLFVNWSIKKELTLFGLFFWFFTIEDFLWFVENDYFGLKNFKQGRIFWHRRWIWGIPVSYFWAMFIGLILITAGAIK